MTIEEINIALEKRGWSQADLARKLCMNPISLNRILRGRAALSSTLSAHIELLLNSTQEQLVMFKLTFPEVLCQAWLPGWKDLSPEQRKDGIEAVLMEAAKMAAQEAERAMTYDEIERLKAFCAVLRGPAKEYEYEAAEPEN